MLEDTAAPAEPAVQETTAAHEPVETSQVNDAPPDIDSDLQAIWDKHNPARDGGGKFVSTKPVEDQSPEPVAPEPAQPAIQAPVSWSAEMKAKFGTLPPDVQEYLNKRDSETHSAITRLGQQVKQTEPLTQILEQNRDTFTKYGLKFEDGIIALLKAQRELETNGPAAIQHLAREFGVDLSQFAAPQEGEGQPNREVAALNAKFAHLERQLNETSSRVMTREQREAEQTRQSLEALITEFAKTKPDYAEIEDDLASLIPVVKARNPGLSNKEILEAAYEQAQWINPDRRARKLEADKKAAEAKAAEDARKKATDAKRLQSINVRTGDRAREAPKSVDDELSAIALKHYGRVA